MEEVFKLVLLKSLTLKQFCNTKSNSDTFWARTKNFDIKGLKIRVRGFQFVLLETFSEGKVSPE